MKTRKPANRNYMGVAWYREDQWSRLLEISSDRDELEGTYAEWHAMAEKNLKLLNKQGYSIQKVDLDVEELLHWCNSQSRDVDGDARSEFVSIKLRELKKKAR